MPTTPFRPRFTWIALAAFVGAVLTAGEVSACQVMPDAGACPPVCGCCKAPEPATPIRHASEPATISQRFTSPNGNVCPDKPVCVCSPQAPVVPEPKGQRAEESRPDPGRDVAAGGLDPGSVYRLFIGPVPPTISPPQKTPPYLRHSRLLI